MSEGRDDQVPKVYLINYKVYGVDHKNIMHVIVTEPKNWVIAMDAQDVIDQLKRDYVNVEFNHNDKDGMVHLVGQHVYVESIKYCGVLSGMSLKSVDALSGIKSESEEEEEL